MVLVTVEAARAFDIIFFMTGGGPGDVSTTLTWEVYRVFYKNNQYGQGSALGWLLVILTTIITTDLLPAPLLAAPRAAGRSDAGDAPHERAVRSTMNGRRFSSTSLAALLVIWTLVPIYWLLNMSLMFKTELLVGPDPPLSRTIRRSATTPGSSAAPRSVRRRGAAGDRAGADHSDAGCATA